MKETINNEERINNMTKKFDLGIRIEGFDAFQKIRELVFNRSGLEIFGLTIQGKNTEFAYALSCNKKLTLPSHAAVRSYIEGIVDCLKSF